MCSFLKFCMPCSVSKTIPSSQEMDDLAGSDSTGTKSLKFHNMPKVKSLGNNSIKAAFIGGLSLAGHSIGLAIVSAVGLGLLSNPVSLVVVGLVGLVGLCMLAKGVKQVARVHKSLVEDMKTISHSALNITVGLTICAAALSTLIIFSIPSTIILLGLGGLALFGFVLCSIDNSSLAKSNEQKFEVIRVKLRSIDQGNMASSNITAEFTAFIKDGGRKNWHALVDKLSTLTGNNLNNDTVKEVCYAIYTADMQSYYKQYVEAYNTGTFNGQSRGVEQITGIDSFMAQINGVGTTKSQLGIAKQQRQGTKREVGFKWLYSNLPTELPVDTKLLVDGQTVEARSFRHGNAAIAIDKGQDEVMDPIFKAYLNKLKVDNKVCFYTAFLNPNNTCENRGVEALRSEDKDADSNFHMLQQSMDAPLYKEQQSKGLSAYFDAIIEKYEAESDPFFVLPNFISQDPDLKKNYIEEVKSLKEDLVSKLGDIERFSSHKQQQAYCLIFYALQRDHMKVFMNDRALKIGHYTTPCKDFLDRGGTAFATEMALHHFMKGNNNDNAKDSQFLQSLFIKMSGASLVTKGVGVLEKRIEPFKEVFTILEGKRHELNTGFSYTRHNQQPLKGEVE